MRASNGWNDALCWRIGERVLIFGDVTKGAKMRWRHTNLEDVPKREIAQKLGTANLQSGGLLLRITSSDVLGVELDGKANCRRRRVARQAAAECNHELGVAFSIAGRVTVKDPAKLMLEIISQGGWKDGTVWGKCVMEQHQAVKGKVSIGWVAGSWQAGWKQSEEEVEDGLFPPAESLLRNGDGQVWSGGAAQPVRRRAKGHSQDGHSWTGDREGLLCFHESNEGRMRSGKQITWSFNKHEGVVVRILD
jgi:hypothetical protein